MQDAARGAWEGGLLPLCTTLIRLHPETSRVLGHGGHRKTGGSSGADTKQLQGLQGVGGEAEGSGFVQPEDQKALGNFEAT